MLSNEKFADVALGYIVFLWQPAGKGIKKGSPKRNKIKILNIILKIAPINRILAQLKPIGSIGSCRRHNLLFKFGFTSEFSKENGGVCTIGDSQQIAFIERGNYSYIS
jgi:hypothetical protein